MPKHAKQHYTNHKNLTASKLMKYFDRYDKFYAVESKWYFDSLLEYTLIIGTITLRLTFKNDLKLSQ